VTADFADERVGCVVCVLGAGWVEEGRCYGGGWPGRAGMS
jgi:hypothetical protein